MSKNVVVIVSAIVGKSGITLYHEDGKETNLALDGRRTKDIMDKVTPFIARHEKVEIDLQTFDVHAHIERKTGGLIRFVREKIASVRSWFKPTAEDEVSKDAGAFEPTQPVNDGAYGQHTYGVPAADPESETVVAIIGDKKVPGVEALEKHIERAIETGDTEGVEAFMKRIASVIDKRGHSVQELLNFMRNGDLPIAKDGSIVAYKVLKTRHDGKIVDCHSGKVTQGVGSRVVMDEKLVDPSRRTLCSTGLHVARRGYLSGFSGDVIMMIKIAPEDVIAVPIGEPDKMRVAAYHVVAEVPKKVHHLLRQNRPMTTDDDAAKILADVIAGNHVGVLEEVRITEPRGGGIVITKIAEQSVEIVQGVSGTVKALDDEPERPVLTVKEIRDTVKATGAAEPEAEITKQHVQMIRGELHVDGEKIETETAQERRNRIKREKRAAAKAAAGEKISEAAPTDKSKPVAKKAKVEKPKRFVEAVQLTDKQQKVLDLHAEGLSARQIEKQLRMCRKTIAKIIAAHG